jgi:large repetitive protein
MRRVATILAMGVAVLIPGAAVLFPSVAQADSTIYVGTAPLCPDAQFSNLATAVEYAQPHDTIRICPGTYTVGPTTATTVPATGLQGLVIDKTLQIYGAGASRTFIEPTQNLALPGSATDNVRDKLGNIVTVQMTTPGDTSDQDVNPIISGVTITDGGYYVDAGIAFNNAAGTISDSTIGPFTGSQPTAAQPNVGWGVVASNNYAVTPQGAFERDVTVSNNLITGYGGGGVLIDGSESTKPIYFRSGVATTGAITGNTITGAGSTSEVQQYGVQVNAGARAAITGNKISGNLGATAGTATNPGTGVGILLTDADVTTNTVGSTTAYYTKISGNDLTGNGYGIFNGTADFPGAFASDPNQVYPIEVNGTGHTPTDLPTLTNTAQSTTAAPVTVDFDSPGVTAKGSASNYYGTAGPVIGGPSTATADGISESTAGGADSVPTTNTKTAATIAAAPGTVTDAPPTVAWGTPDGTDDTTLTAGTADELLVVATDDFGVQSVDINADGTDLGTLTLPPYETTWTPPVSLEGQTVTLTATVTDEDNQTTVVPITVTVVPPASKSNTGGGSTGTGSTGTGSTGTGSTGTGGGSTVTAPTISLPATFGTAKHPLTALSIKPTFGGTVVAVGYRLDGKRICATATSPFTCAVALTGADPGKHVLTITAYASATVDTTLTRTIYIAKFNAKLTAKSVSKNGRVTVSGKLTLPKVVTRAQGCGKGSVTISSGRHRTTAKVTSGCTFSAKLSGVKRGARITVAFGGNTALALEKKTLKAA